MSTSNTAEAFPVDESPRPQRVGVPAHVAAAPVRGVPTGRHVPNPAIPSIAISPDGIFRWLIGGIALLVAASTAGQVSRFFLGHDNLFGFVRLTYLNGETTIPSWFSSSLLLACAAALGAIAMVERGRGGRDARHWLGLAVIFAVLSLDEGAGVHEISSGLLRRRFGLDGFLRFASVIPLALAAVVIGATYARFLWRLAPPTRGWLVRAGALYVGGAVGVESLSAKYFSANGHTFGYSVFVTIEEAAEMAGVALFLYALLDYLGRRGGVRLSIRSPQPAQQEYG